MVHPYLKGVIYLIDFQSISIKHITSHVNKVHAPYNKFWHVNQSSIRCLLHGLALWSTEHSVSMEVITTAGRWWGESCGTLHSRTLCSDFPVTHWWVFCVRAGHNLSPLLALFILFFDLLFTIQWFANQ